MIRVRICQCDIVFREYVSGAGWRVTYGNGWPFLGVSLLRGWSEFVRTLRRLLSIRVHVRRLTPTPGGTRG